MMEQMWLIWFAVGVVLALLEMVLPGFIVLFFGIGCWCVAILLLIGVDLSLPAQIAVFLIASVGALLALRKWCLRTFRGVLTDCPDKEFDDQPIGNVVKVTASIRPPETGRIFYRGTEWDASAEDVIEAGQQVEIVGRHDRHMQQFIVKSIQTKGE